MAVRVGTAVHTASLPALRAVLFTTGALGLSVIAHVGAGGDLPAPATMLAGGLLTLLAHRLYLGRTQRSWPMLAGTLGLIELILHMSFSSAVGDLAGMGMGTAHRPAVVGDAACPTMTGWAPTSTSQMLAMLGSHALATLLLACLLRIGEDAAWAGARRAALTGLAVLLRSGCLIGRRPVTATGALSLWRPTIPADVTRPLALRTVSVVVSRRGPPR